MQKLYQISANSGMISRVSRNKLDAAVREPDSDNEKAAKKEAKKEAAKKEKKVARMDDSSSDEPDMKKDKKKSKETKAEAEPANLMEDLLGLDTAPATSQPVSGTGLD